MLVKRPKNVPAAALAFRMEGQHLGWLYRNQPTAKSSWTCWGLDGSEIGKRKTRGACIALFAKVYHEKKEAAEVEG